MEERSLGILYEDKHILLCEKPAGMPAQPDKIGNTDLLSVLSETRPSVKPVHRLDTPTGGIMVFGLTAAATGKLGVLVQDHEQFDKMYMAVVAKAPEVPEGEMQDYLYHDQRLNKSFTVNSARKGAKAARLSYRTLAVSENGAALVLVKLHSGRTHQIRVQFASRGMPLAGDGKYGSRVKAPFIGLWAHRLSFPHPITGRPITASSLPPTDAMPWSEFADTLRQ